MVISSLGMCYILQRIIIYDHAVLIVLIMEEEEKWLEDSSS